MLEYIKFLNDYINVPAKLIAGIVVLLLCLQLVGELLEFCGKVAPGFMKLRKKAKENLEKERKRDELIAAATEALDKANQKLDEFTALYNDDNLNKRNIWMRAVDTGISENKDDIHALAEKMEKIYDISMKDHIEALRSVILNFANRVSDKNGILTHEEFRRAFAAYEDYEAFLKEHGLTNGQVDVAYRVISEDYADRLRNHEFLEDIRGY
jgi:hypothetical protein